MSDNITYFYRNSRAGYSIAKVMNNLSQEISKQLPIEEFYVPEYRAGLRSIIKNIVFVYKHRNKVGVNHVTGDIHYCLIALIGCKTVLTIHDMVFYKFEKNILKKIFLKLLWFDIPLLLADKVVCISKTIKEEISTISKRKDIVVIYNSISKDFSKSESKFNNACPCILQIGTNWNKNIENLILSIKDVKCRLRIIGKLDDSKLSLLRNNGIDYSNVYDLNDNEVIEEYRRCDIVSFCSIYEGFGMPIIEANSIGRCVLTSNINPMVEVASNAAYFVDPYDCKSILSGIWDLINNEALRQELLSNGYENAMRFKVENSVNEYFSIYRDLK